MIPLCWGTSGSVRARQIAQSASCAREVHTFCPVSRHPSSPAGPVERTARVRREARSDPAPGSLNSWHQVSSPSSVGRTKRSRCSSEPCARIVGAAHPPIFRSGSSTPAAFELLVDDELGDGVGPQPVRLRPVRGEVSRVDQGGALPIRRDRGDLRDPAAYVVADALVAAAEVDLDPAPLPGDRALGQGRRPRVGRAEQVAQGHRPPQVEVCVVLEGEPDAAEHLDAGLGVAYRTVEGNGPGDVGCERPLVVVGEGDRRGVPGRGRHRLRRLQHLGAEVLDRLEAADLGAELLAHAGVLHRRLEAPPGDPGGLGGSQGDGHPPQRRLVQAGNRLGLLDRDVDRHRTEPPGQVEADGSCA